MFRIRRSSRRFGRPTRAMVVACTALFMALGGVGYAAATIGSAQIKNNSVQGKDIKNGTIKAPDIAKATQAALKGAKGADGARGSSGSAGPAGPAGPQGAQGPVGPATGAAGGALAGNYPNPSLSLTGRGPALGGARLTGVGAVVTWFNRRGSTPTVAHLTDSGIYNITFPGSNFNINTNVIAVASLAAGPGEVGVDTLGGAIQVRTYTSAGVPSDSSFTVSVFDASTTG